MTVPAASPSEEARRSRLVGIEGMRALAACSIVVYHVWNFGYGTPVDASSVDFGILSKFFSNLRAGVTLFFVLSGFLLFRPYVAAALRARPTPSLRRYFRNRALRILPAYWVILLVVAVLFQRELFEKPHQLLANMAFLQNYIPSYHPTDGYHGLGIAPAWSLAIEVVFYLCVPVLGAMAIRLASRGRAPAVWAAFVPVALLVLLGATAKVAYRVFPELGRTWEKMGFPTHADWFAVGMALAVARVLWEDGRFVVPRWWPVPALAGIALLVAPSAKLWYMGTLAFVEYQTVVAVACGLLLSLVVFAPPSSRVLAVLEWKPVLATGLASYSLFLWNDPLVRALRDAGLTLPGRGGFFVNLLLVGVVCAIASALTYLLVEKPALARKRDWRERGPQPTEAEPVGSLEESDLRPATQASAAAR